MKINSKLVELCSDEHDINYFMLLLYQMAFERSGKTTNLKVVELGVRTGNSTLSFLAGLARAENGGMLYSCDIQKSDCAEAAVSEAALSDFWKFYPETDSVEFAGNVDFEPGIVFIDTSHEFGHTTKELDVWSRKLSKGGRIILHDTLSRPEGVGVPVKNFLKSNPNWKYYNIDVGCGLGILDKP